jgi:cytochrome P450
MQQDVEAPPAEATSEVPFLNIIEPGFDYESAQVAQAREQYWYAHTPLGPMVLRHEEGLELLKDRRFRLGGEHYPRTVGIQAGPLYDWWMNTLMSAPPADHARMRGLVNRAFTPRVIDALRPFMKRTAVELAHRLPIGEECEFVAAFAEPLPARVMCKMLGVPVEDYDRFHRGSNEIAMAFSRQVDGQMQDRVETALADLSAYVASLIAAKRTQPEDDLLSQLIAAEEDGERLSATELQNLSLMLVWAGQDTPSRQLGRAIVAFAKHPDQWQILGDDPALALQAVEEVCRWTPQTRTLLRSPMHDLEYRGLQIPANTTVLILAPSCNHDPRAFDDPERFDVRAERSARQLVFGGGPFNCLGSGIARAEMAEGLAILAQRFEPPVVVGPIAWRPAGSMIHGPDVLPVRFELRSP